MAASPISGPVRFRRLRPPPAEIGPGRSGTGHPCLCYDLGCGAGALRPVEEMSLTDPLEWGKRPENLGPPPRPLWRDPARALIGLGCVLVVLTVYQDWADGVTPGDGPVFFNGASGSGDGTILVILAGLSAIATFWRPLADATSAIVRIIPLFIGIAMGFEYGTSYRAAAAAVDDWLGSNGHASLTTALLILGLGVAAIVTGALALTLAHLARSRPGRRHADPPEGRGPGLAATDRSADPTAGVPPRTYRVRAGRPHGRRPRT